MDMISRFSQWSYRLGLPAGLISRVGAILLGVVGWHLRSTHIEVMASETNPARFALESTEAVFRTVPPILLTYFGYWTTKQDIPRDCQWLILQWVLAGLVAVVGVITAIDIHRLLLGYPLQRSLVEMELLTGAGVGSILGFAVGHNRASSELRAETIEDQRDAFLFLNRLLRHHILNSIQLIDGYTARLDDKLDDNDDPVLRQMHEIVRIRSQEVTSLIENIRTIVHTFTDTPQLERVNLTSIVEAECDKAHQVYETAELETSLPGPVYVQSNEFLAIVIRNLIDNAIQHNDQPTPHVQVAVEDQQHTVRLRISDNGPGLSKNEVNQLLQPGKTGDRGTGLYLVNRIVTQQDGQLLIGNSTPRGTVVTIELPKSSVQRENRRTEYRTNDNNDETTDSTP